MNNKRLFIGNLPWSVTEEQLQDMFAAIGNLVSCKLIMDKYSGKSKGFAFVEYDDEKDAEKAIKELNEKEVDGRKIIVNVAKPMEERGSGGYNSDNRNNDRRGGNQGGYNRKRY